MRAGIVLGFLIVVFAGLAVRSRTSRPAVGLAHLNVAADVDHFSAPRGVTTSPYVCEADEARAVAKIHFHMLESSCPGDNYWKTALGVAFRCRPLTFVDIGANKGYYIAFFISMLAPSLKIYPKSIAPLIFAVPGLQNGCGVCDDCHVGAFRAQSSSFCTNADGKAVSSEEFGVDIHAIEPILSNIELLKSGVQKLVKDSGSKHVRVHVHQAAAQGDPELESVPFLICPVGNEACGIVLDTASATAKSEVGETVSYNGQKVKIDNVPAITVDTMNKKLGTNIDIIDFLAIDAEGMDPAVIDGAQYMLSSGRVRMLEFEYNSMRKWAETTLKATIDKLDDWGYICFQMQKYTLLRLTHCWDPSYETKYWSNVLCVRANDGPLLHALETFTPA